jgi:hypothetical protein
MNLETYSPFVQSANIRAVLDPKNLTVANGVGYEGDIVMVEMKNIQGKEIVLDQFKTNQIIYPGNKVLAVLGNRESSTHVNGGIPNDGLKIQQNDELDWIGGKSGIVGILNCETINPEKFEAETSTKLKVVGLVQRKGKNLNIEEFSIKPKVSKLTTPIVFIGATSAEAGKTVLTSKIINSLIHEGLKVGAIKTTGSGGTMDGLMYQEAGAHVVLDQVDCGLISTYTNAQKFCSSIIKAYQWCEEMEMDVIVAEMGGDFIWGNNPTLLKHEELNKNISSLFIIVNDALSAIGTLEYLKAFRTPFPIHLLSSPFRNFNGMSKRVKELNNVELLDVNGIYNIKELIVKSVFTKQKHLYGEA